MNLSRISILGLLLFFSSCEITFIERIDPYVYNDGDSVLLSIRPALQYYGCTPTALGMILNYYDAVDSTGDIVSTNHINYYANPKDSRDYLLPDSSVLENPPKNCLADFIHTSWYSWNCFYQATWHYNIKYGVEQYLEYKDETRKLQQDYLVFSNLNYMAFVRGIDRGIPMYMDIVQNINNNHAIVGIGYVFSDTSYLYYNGGDYEVHKAKWNEYDHDKNRKGKQTGYIIRGIKISLK